VSERRNVGSAAGTTGTLEALAPGVSLIRMRGRVGASADTSLRLRGEEPEPERGTRSNGELDARDAPRSARR
jgi:hypothetical protein